MFLFNYLFFFFYPTRGEVNFLFIFYVYLQGVFKTRCRRRQRERQKSNRFIKQNNNFAGASCFLYMSLPSLHDYHVKMPSFTFYGGRKQAKTKFSGIFFFFPNLDKLLDMALCEFSWNSTPGEFAYIELE